MSTSPRRIPSPLFDRGAIPFGRLGDIAALIPAPGRHAFVPTGPGYAAGYYLVRFADEQTLDAELSADAGRCPRDMALRGTPARDIQRGYRPASLFIRPSPRWSGCATCCPHGCQPGSPNCEHNLAPATTGSRCPRREGATL